MFYPSNDLPVPNWPPYEGNFPVAAESAAPAAPAPPVLAAARADNKEKRNAFASVVWIPP